MYASIWSPKSLKTIRAVINDLLLDVNSKVVMYADDSTIVYIK